MLDTNGNGRRDEYVEPGAPVDPDLNKHGLYAVNQPPAPWTQLGTRVAWSALCGHTVPIAEYYSPLDEAAMRLRFYAPGAGPQWR
ncbi:MAG: hypothetical protein ACE37N_09155 [Pseudohongiellaceae bacterium]